MNTNSVKQLNNTCEINFKKAFKWFDSTLCNALNSATNEFWETSYEFKLIGASENENFFQSGTEYFATRIKLSKKHQCVIRLSKEIVQILLDGSLGKKSNFEFEKLTELESKIIMSFNNFVFSCFEDKLLPKEEIQDNENECHLTFGTKTPFGDLAKIIISIPSAYLKYEEIFPSEDKFSISSFPSAKVDVDLFIGKTTLPLNDLKSLEKEDIIVLENSNINSMILNFECNEINFKVSPDPALIISFDNDSEESKNMSNADNIWDNIQVDITAEFEKIKISLGEIKQISEGLVVDMGCVYDNKVNLKVENKTIAKGELVIINDRYGVRIDEVIEEKQEAPTQEPKPQPKQAEPKPQAAPINEAAPPQENPPEEINGEDFDYKDFDVDDENI